MTKGIEAWVRPLLDARAGGPLVEALPGLVDDERAYAVQAEVTRHLGLAAGYKLGFTMADPPPTGLAHAPAHGALLADQVRATGAHLPVAGEPLVECEVVIRTREPLTPDLDVAGLAARVDVAPGIEVPVARFRSWWPVGGAPRITRPEFIADGCLAAHLVVGDAWRPAAGMMLSGVAVTLSCPDGSEVRGTGAAVMGDPIRALAWFVAAAGEVPAGHLVATGTLTPAVRAVEGVYAADFAGLGRVEVSFGA